MKHETFSEYLERRDAALRPARDARLASTDHESHATDVATGSVAPDDPRAIDDPAYRPDYFGERSLFSGVFKAVKPARPASPTNSRLLASPFQKRLGSQVVGR